MCTASARGQAAVFVAVDGGDRASGTRARPAGVFEGARGVVRSRRAPGDLAVGSAAAQATTCRLDDLEEIPAPEDVAR
jgi:hypothetical protein